MMMLRALNSVPWLVGQGRIAHGQQVDAGPILLLLGVAAVVIAGVSVGAYLAHHAAVRRRLNSHPGLFDGLCKVHGLDRGQRALLLQVVRARNVPYPGQVFTEPNWMHPKSLPSPLQAKTAELSKLHKKLFG